MEISWKRRWAIALTVALAGVASVLVVVVAYGEFDVTWLLALLSTVLLLALFTGVVERFRRWRE